MSISHVDWFRIQNPTVIGTLGRVRHVLFDFDGTVSVLRKGWEPVMQAVMLDAICAGNPPMPQLVTDVRDYIDVSTGNLTILQMKWLAEKVKSVGMETRPLTAAEYKKKIFA